MHPHGHFALIITNATALLPLWRCISNQHNFTALLVFLTFVSSTAFHAMNDDNGLREAIPTALKFDRFFAAILALHVAFMPKTRAVFCASLNSALPLFIPACLAGILSELLRGTSYYSPLHSLWHVFIFLTLDTFYVSSLSTK